jgi:hypothetical protein
MEGDHVSHLSVVQTSSLMRMARLFSAAISLDPVAVAPESVGSEATYSPSDSETLPEYCFPSTVVEKLVTCISWATLLPALAPPPPLWEAWLGLLGACAGALGAEALEPDVAVVVDTVPLDFGAALKGRAIAGLKTVLLEELDAIGVIVIALSS